MKHLLFQGEDLAIGVAIGTGWLLSGADVDRILAWAALSIPGALTLCAVHHWREVRKAARDNQSQPPAPM